MLIEQVRRYPALYDRRNDKYKNTEYREMAWKKIAEDLQIEGKISNNITSLYNNINKKIYHESLVHFHIHIQ